MLLCWAVASLKSVFQALLTIFDHMIHHGRIQCGTQIFVGGS